MTTQNKIKDCLIRIKNAQNIKKLSVTLPKSNFILGLSNVLYENGFINGFIVKNKEIFLLLKYNLNDKPTITKINQISKPGLPKYASIKHLKMIEKKKNLSVFVVSTSKGILSHKKALQRNLGGKLICEIF